jgi:hypothetical protein
MFKKAAAALVPGLLLLMSTPGLAGAAHPAVTFSADLNPPATTSFDISFVENNTGSYFLADRTNNAVDLVNAATTTFLGYIAHGQFVGVVPANKCNAPGNPRACSGPNGVLTDSSHNVWAGDGNSTVKVLKPEPGTGAAAVLANIPTGGKFRADEESYDPADQIVLIANDAEGFLTFLHAAGSSSSVETHFYYADNTVGAAATVPGHATAGGGIEQSVWDPKTRLFYQAVPAAGDTGGFIDVFTPSGQLVKTDPVPNCNGGPTGLAMGRHRELMGACGNGGAVVEIGSGHERTIVGGVGGADEIWFNPGDGNFYFAISGGPSLGIVDGNDDHFVGVVTGHGGHSVAAYAGNNHIFQPESSGSGIAEYVSS